MKQGVQKQLQEKVDAKKLNVHSCFAVTYRSIYICIRKIKPLLMQATVLLFFSLSREVIFL